MHPIIVRKLGDGYELIAGRKRLWAVKQLGLKTIASSVREASDIDVAVISRIENYCRGHLSPVQQALELQGILKEYERL